MKTKQRWLATRVLRDPANPEIELEAQLGLPEPTKGGDFRCAFRVKGLDRGKTVYAGGIDALQALVNALDGLATKLRESGRALMWIDIAGETGIRRQVPIFLGVDLANEIESHIEATIEAVIQSKKGATAPAPPHEPR